SVEDLPPAAREFFDVRAARPRPGPPDMVPGVRGAAGGAGDVARGAPPRPGRDRGPPRAVGRGARRPGGRGAVVSGRILASRPQRSRREAPPFLDELIDAAPDHAPVLDAGG